MKKQKGKSAQEEACLGRKDIWKMYLGVNLSFCRSINVPLYGLLSCMTIANIKYFIGAIFKQLN